MPASEDAEAATASKHCDDEDEDVLHAACRCLNVEIWLLKRQDDLYEIFGNGKDEDNSRGLRVASSRVIQRPANGLTAYTQQHPSLVVGEPGDDDQAKTKTEAAFTCLLCDTSLLTSQVSKAKPALYRLASVVENLTVGREDIAKRRRSPAFSQLFNAVVLDTPAPSTLPPTRSSLPSMSLPDANIAANPATTATAQGVSKSAASGTISPYHAAARAMIKREKILLDERAKRYMQEADVMAWKARSSTPNSRQPAHSKEGGPARASSKDRKRTASPAKRADQADADSAASSIRPPVVLRGGFDSTPPSQVPDSPSSKLSPRAFGTILPHGSITNSLSPPFALPPPPKSPGSSEPAASPAPSPFAIHAGQNFPSLFGSLKRTPSLPRRPLPSASPGPVPNAAVAAGSPPRSASANPSQSQSPTTRSAEGSRVGGVSRHGLDLAKDVTDAKKEVTPEVVSNGVTNRSSPAGTTSALRAPRYTHMPAKPVTQRSPASWLRLNGMSPPSDANRPPADGAVDAAPKANIETTIAEQSKTPRATPLKERHVSFKEPEPTARSASPPVERYPGHVDTDVGTQDNEENAFEMDEDLASTSDEADVDIMVEADGASGQEGDPPIVQSSHSLSDRSSFTRIEPVQSFIGSLKAFEGRGLPGREVSRGMSLSIPKNNSVQGSFAHTLMGLDEQARRMREILAVDAPSHRGRRSRGGQFLSLAGYQEDEISDGELDRIAPVSALATSLPVRIGEFDFRRRAEMEFERKTSVPQREQMFVPRLKKPVAPSAHRGKVDRLSPLGEEDDAISLETTSTHRDVKDDEDGISIPGAQEELTREQEARSTQDVSISSPPGVSKLGSTSAETDANIADMGRTPPGFVPPHVGLSMLKSPSESPDGCFGLKLLSRSRMTPTTLFGTSVRDLK